MRETVESVKAYGILVPAVARPREEGGYELVSGHRRKRACELAGLDTMPVIVQEMDRDSAIIFMADSNLHRENIPLSERAQAYKMKTETMESEQAVPSLSQAQRMKKLSQSGTLSEDSMLAILSETKKPETDRIVLTTNTLHKYFPRSYTPRQMEQTILKLLEGWTRRRQREQAR